MNGIIVFILKCYYTLPDFWLGNILSSFPMKDLIIWPDILRADAQREAVGVEALTDLQCG